MISEFFNPIIDLYLLDPIAQTAGFIGMICVWIAFLYTDDIKTIKMLFIASFFWGILFLLLESYAGFAATLIGMLRLYLSMKYKKNIQVFIFMVILIAITGIITYDSYYSLLPILGSFIGAYSFFFFSGLILRIWCLSISIIWLIYNVHIGSIGGVMNEIVVEILIIITIYNYVGINGYKLLFISKVKSIFHPYANIDYGHYTIVKDQNKVLIKDNLAKRFKNFINDKIKKETKL